MMFRMLISAVLAIHLSSGATAARVWDKDGRSIQHGVDARGDEFGRWRTTEAAAVEHVTWMEDLLQAGLLKNVSLMDTLLPGAHDAGAFIIYGNDLGTSYRGSEFVKAIIDTADRLGLPASEVAEAWSLCHTYDFYEQLSHGIRYLDLRAAWNATQWHTHHRFLGVAMQGLLNDVRRFLDETTAEVLVIEVNGVRGEKHEIEELADMLETTLGPYLVPRSVSLHTPLEQLVAAGQRVVVTMDTEQPREALWAGDAIYNTYCNCVTLDDLVEYNDERVVEFDNGNGWEETLFKLSWTQTPGVKTIAGMVRPGNPKSIYDLAANINPAFADWAFDRLLSGHRVGQIMIIDFYEQATFVDDVIRLNHMMLSESHLFQSI